MRYRVLDLPTKGTGAFTPIPTTNPPASSYGLTSATLRGYPGTLAISEPKPAAVPPISAVRETQSSFVSPDVGFWDKYIPSAKYMGPSEHVGMAKRRLTPIPVPAVSWINTALNAMTGNKIGGRSVTAWPRAFQRWPTIGKG